MKGQPLAAFNRLAEHLPFVALFATFCGFIGYAAAVSYKAYFHIEDVNPREVAQHTFYTLGVLGLAGDLLYLALTT